MQSRNPGNFVEIFGGKSAGIRRARAGGWRDDQIMVGYKRPPGVNKMKITFLYYEDCPSHEQALGRLRTIMTAEGISAEIEIIKVETEAQARRYHFVGSPTILVDGQDIDPPSPEAVPALTCRAYRLEDGRISPLPSADMIRRALRATL